MSAFYNEHDPFAAAWLRNLIAAGLIAPGEVDERDIRDIAPDELHGFTQCHFFAGIGGWSLAARLAGWSDDRPLWTGSCPCQSFSAAGRGGGFADERHLWPSWFHLIRELRPAFVFGEQVEAAVRHGWLDLVCSDLEGEGYAVGAAVLGAHSVGAPHIRQRLWWVANTHAAGLGEQRHGGLLNGERSARGHDVDGCGSLRGMGDASSAGSGRHAGAVPGAQGEGDCERSEPRRVADEPVAASGVGDAESRRAATGEQSRQVPSFEQTGPWGDLEWLPCRDGKARPTQSRFQSMADGLWPSMVGSGATCLPPLATGIPSRVGTLRGAGNAIVPQVAAEVIRAFMECRP